MADVIVVGGGPAGLSGALFTQKNGLETTVLDTDKTWVHKAHFFNYPGIGSIDGTAYLTALRRQVESFGTTLQVGTEVVEISAEDTGFHAKTDAETFDAKYLILATGTNRDLAASLGCDFEDDLVSVNLSMETSVENAYATGAMVRGEEWQAVISAGDGAAAALHILSKERGEKYHDFDVPNTADDVFGELADSI